jgi:hypothetical protein
MVRKCLVFSLVVIAAIVVSGCTRKFTVIPQLKNADFTVEKNYGEVVYYPMLDARDSIDKKGKVESTCSGGTAGVIHLGDKNYNNSLLNEFNKNLFNSVANSHLFSSVRDSTYASDSVYSFISSLDKFHVTLDEAKAQRTQACIGGLLGAVIASGIDVSASTDVQITGKLLKNKIEVWRQSISKQIVQHDSYAKAQKNAENSMGIAIAESCNDLITEMAKYLSAQPTK